MDDSTENYEYLVVDSGAIIRGHGYNFHRMTNKICTIQEVVSEIRDSKSRHLLESLPFEIEIRSPSNASLLAVSEFARKTGDSGALSGVDLKVLALAHTLECELNKDVSHLRKEPKFNIRVLNSGQKNVAEKTIDSTQHKHAVKSSAEAVIKVNTTEATKVDSVLNFSPPNQKCDETDAHNNDSNFNINLISDKLSPPSRNLIDNDNNNNKNDNNIAKLTETMSWASIASKNDSSSASNIVAPKKKTLIMKPKDIVEEVKLEKVSKSYDIESEPSKILSNGYMATNSAIASKHIELEDDGEDWVGPSNLAIFRAHGAGMDDTSGKIIGKKVVNKSKVACVTTDFSMQNILIQIGLTVVSVDGMLIEKVKQWVLRCVICFQVHYDMDRLFCSSCGGNNLTRVACSIDNESGQLKLHLRKDYKVNTRGTKYNIPKAGQQGRFEGELLLREDQLLTGIWRQKTVKIKKDIRSAFGDELTSDVGLHINKSQSIKVGLGKKNPNSQKGRERRGKSKK